MIGPIGSSLALEATVGPRFGFPLTDVEVLVTDGGGGGERDSELGLHQAASQALRAALAEAEVTLLEPVMRFDIEAPAEFMSGILGELNAQRADIQDLSVDGDLRRVTGTVPLVRMFGYATTLRSLSQGRASFALSPAGFRPVPEEELAERGLVWQ